VLVAATLVGTPFVIDAIHQGPLPALALPYFPGFYGLWLLEEVGLDFSDHTGDITVAQQVVFVSLSGICWFVMTLGLFALLRRMPLATRRPS
jgi:hypothetical protein